MNTDGRISPEQHARNERGGFFRRSVMAMAMIAVFGYVVAFVQADRGTVHYKAYVAAYTNCFQHIVEAEAAAVNCNYVPEVREHLIAHREAFAVGDPFLNLALSLTAAVLLSPLIHRFGRWLVSRLQPFSEDHERTVSHPA